MEARAAKKRREITEEDLLRITLLVMLWRLTKKFAFFGFRLIDEGFENESVINPQMLRRINNPTPLSFSLSDR